MTFSRSTRRTASSICFSPIRPRATAACAASENAGVAMIKSLPEFTATAAASTWSAQTRWSQTIRPTLSQSVTSVPAKPHSRLRTSLSSHRLAVMGTPSIDW
jgi:hypothetical protein